MNAGKYILIAFAIILVIGIVKNLTDESNATQIENDYSSNWLSPSRGETSIISTTLMKNNVSGCGEFFIKKKKRSSSVYAVACTSDGKTFNYYLVWPKIDEVVHITDDGITKPPIR
jgi:hypothetical protein